mmetsp:Transcript_20722/g.33876  ORF Transcript_20722/g.33876 Transcript_20722/m.33876 type:complete len:120 (-) Transcript_20722:153-512(-)
MRFNMFLAVVKSVAPYLVSLSSTWNSPTSLPLLSFFMFFSALCSIRSFFHSELLQLLIGSFPRAIDSIIKSKKILSNVIPTYIIQCVSFPRQGRKKEFNNRPISRVVLDSVWRKRFILA